MAVITISSDLGVNNFSVSSLFSSLSLAFPNDHVNHLFHHDDAYDIESIAYHVKGALQLFPIRSIHVVFCKYSLMNYDLILLRMNDQYLLTSNNGAASMIMNDELDYSLYKFSSQMKTFDFQQYVDQFIFVLNLIANNEYTKVLDVDPNIVQTKPFTNGLMIREDSIISRVVAIRSSGSIILNLLKKQFDRAVGDKSFYIQFVTVKIRSISPNYMVSETNNKVGAIFNESGFLEIFMIGGNLAKLFNINKYSNNKIEIIIGNDVNNQISFER